MPYPWFGPVPRLLRISRSSVPWSRSIFRTAMPSNSPLDGLRNSVEDLPQTVKGSRAICQLSVDSDRVQPSGARRSSNALGGRMHVAIVAVAVALADLRSGTLRIHNERLRDVVRVILARSATFRTMIERLERSNVFVYIEVGQCPSSLMVSCANLMGGAGGY